MTGNIPTGNILLSSAVLFSGCNINKVFRLFRFMNVVSISVQSFHKHQRDYLWPSIDCVWTKARECLIRTIKERAGPVVLAGDGRSDSPGHCAKYGSYTLLDVRSGKVIELQLVQVSIRNIFLSVCYLLQIL